MEAMSIADNVEGQPETMSSDTSLRDFTFSGRGELIRCFAHHVTIIHQHRIIADHVDMVIDMPSTNASWLSVIPPSPLGGPPGPGGVPGGPPPPGGPRGPGGPPRGGPPPGGPPRGSPRDPPPLRLGSETHFGGLSLYSEKPHFWGFSGLPDAQKRPRMGRNKPCSQYGYWRRTGHFLPTPGDM